MTVLPEPATETPAARPPALPAQLAEHRPALAAYAELLVTAGVERGLLGPREAPRVWDRHLLNCVGLADVLEPGWSVLDLGSGAGLPGVVLAIVRPDLTVTLVEPLLRRATFLEEVRAALGLANVRVLRARAEELRDVEADAVVARAVAPLDRLAGWALPLLRADGLLVAMKGAGAAEEVARTAKAVDRAGGSSPQIRTVGAEADGTAATVVLIHARPRTPSRRRSAR